MASIGSTFNFPEACLVGQRIGKALFADNGPLTPADRRTFRNEIEEIVCSYVLDERHGILLTKHSDEEHDYSCLAQVDVFLRKQGKAVRVAELCHRAMPYPLLVVLHEGDALMFSMAEKRFSRDGKEQVVLEREVHTSWHAQDSLAQFCGEAAYGNFRGYSFLGVYRHYMELLEDLNCREVTGGMPSPQMDAETKRELLAEIRTIDRQLETLKAQAKHEGELPRRVELSTKARELRLRRQALVAKLQS